MCYDRRNFDPRTEKKIDQGHRNVGYPLPDSLLSEYQFSLSSILFILEYFFWMKFKRK